MAGHPCSRLWRWLVAVYSRGVLVDQPYGVRVLPCLSSSLGSGPPLVMYLRLAGEVPCGLGYVGCWIILPCPLSCWFGVELGCGVCLLRCLVFVFQVPFPQPGLETWLALAGRPCYGLGFPWPPRLLGCPIPWPGHYSQPHRSYVVFGGSGVLLCHLIFSFGIPSLSLVLLCSPTLA